MSVAKMPATGEACMVAAREIIVDFDFNVRQSYDDGESLEKSIRKQGILNPVLVRRREDGALELVSGFRRMRALRAIHGEKIGDVMVPVLIREMGLKSAYIANLAENESRASVKRYDLADRLVILQDKHAFKGTQLAAMIGMSNATVSNLLSCRTKLARPILDFWKSAATVDDEIPISRLTAWSKATHDEQIAAFDAYLREIGKAPEGEAPEGEAPDGEGAETPPPPPPPKCSLTLRGKAEIMENMICLKEMQSHARASGKEWTAYQEGVLCALEWVLKEREILPAKR